MALKQFAAHLLDRRFARYVGASAVGTVADLGALFLLYYAGLAAGIAAAAGYALGTLVHWLISSRLVFPDRLANPGLKRSSQQVMFFASALIGIGLTTVIVGLGEAAGISVLLSKIAAMGTSFLTVWLVRLTLVFRARR